MIKMFVFIFFIFSPLVSNASCFKLASDEFGIDWRVIYSIAKVESNYDANAFNVNKNGSIDIGMMQINTVHLHELVSIGVTVDDLLKPCSNVIIGTWLLKKSINKYNGDVWKGVGFYHSATPLIQKQYIHRVRQAFATLNEQLSTGL